MRLDRVRFEFRIDTAENWSAKNPILREGEPGVQKSDAPGHTPRMKLGDGVTRWNDLPYFTGFSDSGGTTSEELLAHINSPTPHPVYDSGPSLALKYQNAKT